MELMTSGAALFAIGIVLGFALGRIARKEKNKLKCGCKHAMGYHIDGKGVCRKDIPFSYGGCSCQFYDGPIHYDEFVARQVEP